MREWLTLGVCALTRGKPSYRPRNALCPIGVCFDKPVSKLGDSQARFVVVRSDNDISIFHPRIVMTNTYQIPFNSVERVV